MNTPARYDIHCMLVSAQPTPNLTPALDPACRPKQIVLLVSPDMHQRANWLMEIYRPRGISVMVWTIDNAWDFSHIQERILELFEAENISDLTPGIALNATGGTKPMSIACYEVFRLYNQPIYYVHPELDQLVWLSPTGEPPYEISETLRIVDMIHAHGARVLGKCREQVAPARREFSQLLIDRIDFFAPALSVLSWYASSAEAALISKPLDSAHLGYGAFPELVDHLTAIGMVTAVGKALHFTDEESRFFSCGGWLEQYVFACVNSLKSELSIIQDTAQGLEIEWAGKGSRNELDVVILANNRLRLIECKSRNFSKLSDLHVADALYKLDSLVDAVGGLQAKPMLISYQELNSASRRRAQDLNIDILQFRELQGLRPRLQQWLLS